MRLPRRTPVRRLPHWPREAGPLPPKPVDRHRSRCWALTLGEAGAEGRLTVVGVPLWRLFGADNLPRALALQRRQGRRWRTLARWPAPLAFWIAALPEPVAGRDLRLVWEGRRLHGRLAPFRLQRPGAHALPEILHRLGADLPGLLALRYGGDALRYLALRRAERAPPWPLQSLRLCWYGRFGNNVVQLVHALALAERQGIPRILMPPHPLLDPRAGGAGVPALVSDAPDDGGSVLQSELFWPQLFPATLAGLSALQRRQLVQERVRPLLPQSVQAAAGDPAELVIHLRGGDLFSSRRPAHPSYAQPPLAFYRRCLEEAWRRWPLSRVRLVSQDRRNPCVDALLDVLARQGVSCRLQSGDFVDDLAALLGARVLVASLSSLMGVAVLLSHRLEGLFTFAEAAGGPLEGYGCLGPLSGAAAGAWGVTHLDLRDRAGGYFRPGEWRNAPEQRALMLDYPDASLEIGTSSV